MDLSEKSHIKPKISRFILVAGLMLIFLVYFPVYGEVQAKTLTEISISLDPADPVEGQEFYINGNLSTESGEPLGNKWVVLESTAAGARPGPFDYLAVTRTALDGSYQFYRPPASPPEDLHVVFKGLYDYNSSVSSVVSAKK